MASRRKIRKNAVHLFMMRILIQGELVRRKSDKDRLGSLSFRQQDRSNTGMGRAVAASEIDAADVERRRKRVGLRSSGGENGSAGDAGRRPARSRIEYVAQLLSVVFQML